MAEKLTPQQEQAVTNRGGQLLVSAAAGSGKTKVLVERVMGYLTDVHEEINIDDFLIITYTKAAAAELRGKIAARLSQSIAADPENRHLQRQMQRLYLAKISTVHAFCNDILREYLYRLDIAADFRMADETECAELRQRTMDQLLDDAYAEPDDDFLTFVDTQGLGRTDALVPEIIQRVYDSARCHVDPERWLDMCLENAQTEQMQDAAQTVWGQELMTDLFSCLDLQIDAIARCVRLAEAKPELNKAAAVLKNHLEALQFLRQSTSWDEVVKRGQISYDRLVFPKKFDDPELSETIKAIRSDCKDRLAKKLRAFTDPSAYVLADIAQTAPAVRGMIALVRKFGKAYEAMKRRYRVLDFSDLEHKALDLLLGKQRTGATSISQEIGSRFREILVDEFQDSNAVQDAIFTVLTAKKQNLFMVGDAKQSIYRFRLADPGIFLKRYESYAPVEKANPKQGRKVMLSSNFRSSGGVISAVNDVFSYCMSQEVGELTYGEEEALREGIPHIPLPDPEVELHTIEVRQDTYSEEADFVAHRIAELLSGNQMIRSGDALRPIQPEDIVILLRSPESMKEQYIYALKQRGISCATDSSVNLMKTAEVETLHALLQVISNPRQDIPLLAVLASPLFGYTANDLAEIRSKQKNCPFFDALLLDTGEQSRKTCDMLVRLRQEARMNSLTGLLEKIFVMLPVMQVYGAGDLERSKKIQTFFTLAMDFEANGRRGLEPFLEHLQSDNQRMLPGEQSRSGSVSLMSIHKSKGLEFPVVFLCGLSRHFNKESLSAQVLCHKEKGVGVSCVDEKNRVRYPTISKRAIAVKLEAEGLSEELRVLYVAMTRARDRLIMTFAQKNLEKKLKTLVACMNGCDRRLLTSGVSCPGEWVLLAALRRTEAGALFALGGKPQVTAVSDHPWKITVMEAREAEPECADAETELPTPVTDFAALQESLTFRYAFQAATAAPSKQTATQRKGRQKDQEAAQDAVEREHPKRVWRRPSFAGGSAQSLAYGNAIHAALQFIRYEACTDADSVAQEISRLVEQGLLTAEQGKLVDSSKIAAFFATPLGAQLRKGKDVLREFKFSVLEDASDYDDGLEGEKILLQGVVDCALVEEDGITVVDFKTD